MRVLGGSKFIHIHKVGCHLPPYRAAVAVAVVGAAGEPKNRWGLVFIIWYTAKDSIGLALRPSRSLR
ncbi:MAG: hypothetical protein GQ469_08090 [Methanosarcinales archaeon]|nr:hypothetical protein [Methanosarcinales archaeon]